MRDRGVQRLHLRADRLPEVREVRFDALREIIDSSRRPRGGFGVLRVVDGLIAPLLQEAEERRSAGSTRLVSERPISSSDAPRPEFGLFDVRLAHHLSKCQSQLIGHRGWLLSSDLDNRDENHPMAVRVNSLWIFTPFSGHYPAERSCHASSVRFPNADPSRGFP